MEVEEETPDPAVAAKRNKRAQQNDTRARSRSLNKDDGKEAKDLF